MLLRTRHSKPCRRGFTLVELMVVIGIIAILFAMLLPVLKRAREQAVVTQCAANLHAISIAFNNYLIDSRNMVFWRAADIAIDGMDWCTWGGREQNNLFIDQKNLMNRIIPRPLNRYASNKIDVFRCPADEGPYVADEDGSRFEEVGNSYNFNADGYPMVDDIAPIGVGSPGSALTSHGLAGVKITEVKDSARTIVFYDAGMLYTTHWHPHYRGNICLADGHVEFAKWPKNVPGEDFVWH